MTKLGRKQLTDNQQWIDALADIENRVTRDELDELTVATVAAIKTTVADKQAAFAWSAGKDSIVLAEICKTAGVTRSMMGVCNLEYPAFLEWAIAHKPAGCEIINTGQDLDWLSKHTEMLFPKDSKTASRWFSIVQHRAQAKYHKAQKLDVLILGRRRADGNYVGAGSNIYTDGRGMTRYSPLADWSHEYVLAYIHYHSLELPPIYGWPNGFICGTHPWSARTKTQSDVNGWDDVYSIDRDIVATAAEKIDGARLYMEGISNEGC